MKIITVETLKKFLDELNKKYGTEFYTKTEADTTFQRKGESSGGEGADAFFKWLKERNYDLTNFQGLDGTFPVKDFPEIKAANLAGGDTKIAGTGAPNTIVEYDGKQAQTGNDGYFVLEGITPLVDGDLIQITCYDYAGRKKTFSIAVGKIEYAVPEGTTEITSSIVKQYNLNRAGRLIFPPSVKSVKAFAFNHCTNLTSVSFPGCINVENYAFSGCSSLTSISFPSCIKTDECSFQRCTLLKKIHLPLCEGVGENAFGFCSSLTNVSFPLCKSLGQSAFYENKVLTSVSLPECTSVGDSAFRICESLTSVSLPSCASFDASLIFYGSPNVKTVVLSEKWIPNRNNISTKTTVYNQDQTKKVDWDTMSWVNV